MALALAAFGVDVGGRLGVDHQAGGGVGDDAGLEAAGAGLPFEPAGARRAGGQPGDVAAVVEGQVGAPGEEGRLAPDGLAKDAYIREKIGKAAKIKTLITKKEDAE